MASVQVSKQLGVLQNQLMDSNRKVDLVQQKVSMVMRQKRRNHFMSQEIDTEPKPEKIYCSVGRMYLISSVDEMKKEITDNDEDLDQKLKSLQAQHKYLADENENIQKNLQEFIKQHS
mmetsp:Transcript_22060/g.30322  ORF Transcript_22060/g.30322 Transcript_22060/m.30322 type:complete len:118 (+) Transcript_22060:78-431(+)|eukprot:CAMPEP_0201476820 /NCGR_PEP_ID=MMETSP0151_2-20130828/1958_1 /ASSEMBLY_ACC=CAM_ASM_000257 /TAXON_ID=200890 /ORGANISM="Paramoeba atlantica, Strain 621/1 / CCAP 1560/9" /LENGTH=117 /DNA_ID=CAMNT_0047857323 /DNA_START=78 /DNA_END=431 /DNA_ORIENTATION=-